MDRNRWCMYIVLSFFLILHALSRAEHSLISSIIFWWAFVFFIDRVGRSIHFTSRQRFWANRRTSISPGKIFFFFLIIALKKSQRLSRQFLSERKGNFVLARKDQISMQITHHVIWIRTRKGMLIVVLKLIIGYLTQTVFGTV